MSKLARYTRRIAEADSESALERMRNRHLRAESCSPCDRTLRCWVVRRREEGSHQAKVRQIQTGWVRRPWLRCFVGWTILSVARRGQYRTLNPSAYNSIIRRFVSVGYPPGCVGLLGAARPSPHADYRLVSLVCQMHLNDQEEPTVDQSGFSLPATSRSTSSTTPAPAPPPQLRATGTRAVSITHARLRTRASLCVSALLIRCS
jgi:hypothetical protein